jgi:chorismate mutase
MDISDWRKTIDSLDEQITTLLNQRAAAAIEIGKLKAINAAAIYEPQREQQVYAHVSAVNPGPLTNTELNDIYQRVMDVMRNKQRFNK